MVRDQMGEQFCVVGLDEMLGEGRVVVSFPVVRRVEEKIRARTDADVADA